MLFEMSKSDLVIRVEGLGKKYKLNHEKSERYVALRDVLARRARSAGRLLNPFTLTGQLSKPQRKLSYERSDREEDFWALKDVSFEIRRGERVGIIGRNGAGKSTLLKILSRITEPTTGRVEIFGRVASLLEVGTGFHPELTGRENIYLNGAILGMTRREIRSKFDEIVGFAEVEKFLDMPVKRYSSGMYVRLAFAVAAHLEPEILVVDEVLAVGDISFQKKCISKMESNTSSASTILIVSHQFEILRRLCTSGILLDKGKLSEQSASCENLITNYINSSTASSYLSAPDSVKSYRQKLSPEDLLTIKKYTLQDEQGRLLNNKTIPRSQQIFLVVNAMIHSLNSSLCIGFDLYDQHNQHIFRCFHTDSSVGSENDVYLTGDIEIRFSVPKILNEGNYYASLCIGIHNQEWLLSPGSDDFKLNFEINGGLSSSPFWMHKRPGLIAPSINCEIIK